MGVSALVTAGMYGFWVRWAEGFEFKLKTFGFSRLFHGAKPGAGSGVPLQDLISE